MRELNGQNIKNITKDQQSGIDVYHLHYSDELDKKIPLAAQEDYCAELEELQELLHFPEEVALRLADSEYQLFYQVPPIEYLRQVTLDLGGATAASSNDIQDNLSTKSTVSALIKRFNEVSAWITQLIISQPTHDARRAVLSCVLRVALSCWNIGNFNGAMEIIAGLKSNKLKPFWLSITEKESLPVLDFLSAALLSAEYDRALSRALGMAECPAVPFFGAFLRELREILATCGGHTSDTSSTGDVPTGTKHSKGSTGKEAAAAAAAAKRQVFISDYNGEQHHFTKIGSGGLNNLEKIYRTQAVMDHISLCHQHYHTRNRLSPTVKLIDYLKSSERNQQRVLSVTRYQSIELDSEYDCDLDDYHPVQPLIFDHGVSFVSFSSPHTKIDQHVMQILHHGSTVVLWESGETVPAVTNTGNLLYLRLDRSSTTLTWVRPSWSGLKTGGLSEADPFSADFNLSFSPEDALAPGLLTKLALQAAGDQSNTGSILEDGFLDLMSVKEVHLGGRSAERDAEFVEVARRYGLSHEAGGKECALSILFGHHISDNRILNIVCPPIICRVWFTGLCWLIRGLSRQQSLCDRRIFWLKEQYMQLYHEDGYCCGPLAADAIRSFGGRDWSLAGMSQRNGGEQSAGALRREVSMKIKKKHMLNNQTFKEKSFRNQFVEPATMCMESSYWRSPISHHRQSTPATFTECPPDVVRHHSLGQLPYDPAKPKYDRERHGSTEYLWHGRHPRVGSVLYDTQLDFIDFVALFRSFSLLIRKDLRDIFDQLAISYRNAAVQGHTCKVTSTKLKVEAVKKSQTINLLTRNSKFELEGVVHSQKKIFDAIAAASIFTNCAGIDTNNSQVITMSTFMKFLETRQMEKLSEEQVKGLIYRHEPDPTLRSQQCLSFEGFARYLMDKDNYAFVNECETPSDSEMSRPMATYYIASSHNTYLTGHQLKGESSVELYSQVLLTGCRCVELDCWDGDDGAPTIYHGHTFTTKVAFAAVVEAINRDAFVASPYPIILSIENHCSLHQQTKMAHIFQRVFGDKLVTKFLFDPDFSDEPVLPSPDQLKYRILIKNKKLTTEVPPPINFSSSSTPYRFSSGVRHSVPGRTSSIISNASSSSFNDDFSDDDYEDDDDEENIDEKALQGILMDSSRTYSISHAVSKTSSTKRISADEKLRKRSSQISKELSDLVVYVQAIKFRGLNALSPNSSVKQKQKYLTNSSTSSTVPSGSSSASNISSAQPQSVTDAENVISEEEVKQRPNVHSPCYQCCSINENTAKKLCRKQPLALVAHTQTQLMRTYPAGMRIDSSNFNPLIFWSFGIQMAALNYQTDDISLFLNSALFEMNGRCGFLSKPSVMWDKSHVMYRRFNPWDKEFDGLHSSQIILNVVSGQYVSESNVNTSTFVEVEIIGIPVDCNKQKTKVVQKNALNPIWNDTFYFRVLFYDLAFLKFTIVDSANNHLLAQRILPLKSLRPGYRHLRLRNSQNKFHYMSTLFIYSRVEEESLESTSIQKQSDVGTERQDESNTPLCVKRRMFFLSVYGVVQDEPYTILKITQESTTEEVLKMCLQKTSIPMEKMIDYILVEEVARGWEKKDTNLPSTQRILDLNERPLQAQSQWKGEGKFILKKIGDDPSSRAWLTSIRSVSYRERETKKSDPEISNAWEDDDTFLVCIYNVSPEIPYAILKVPINACAQDVLAQALVKARRLEDPMNFVIVEELQWAGTNLSIQQRALADFENVYNTQSNWQTIGRFILQERANITPTSLRKNRLPSNLRLVTLDRISRGLSAARNAASSSIKIPMQSSLSDPTTFKWKSKSEEGKGKIGRGKFNFYKDASGAAGPHPCQQMQREVHSEGETLSDEEVKESDFMSTVSRLKKVSLKKIKEWKS